MAQKLTPDTEKPEVQPEPESQDRRAFLGKIPLLAAGLVSYVLISMLKAKKFHLRPPGAVEEEAFWAMCMRCGQCAQACPYQSIKMAEANEGVAIGTPYLTAREVPCYLCEDLPCVKACPSGALKLQDAKKARMGTARIDREKCLSIQGYRCEVCYRRCPLMGKAITLEIYHNAKTGKHAIFAPVIHSDKCTGCGVCEHVCITEKPAVRIYPQEQNLV